MSLSAVILDMDGVLVDSEPLWQQAEIEVFARVGVVLTREMCMQTIGLRIDEVVQHWFRRQPWTAPPPSDVGKQVLHKVIELVGERGQAMPGVVAAMDAVETAGLRLALASSSHPDLIDAVLRRLNIRERFVCVHSAQQEPYGKPHPAVYLTTAEKLGVPPTECVAIEDSINGIVAAKAARMRCIAVPDPGFAGDRRLGIADVVVGSLFEVDSALFAQLMQQ